MSYVYVVLLAMTKELYASFLTITVLTVCGDPSVHKW